jgi:DNA-binding response OmpR family regulator
LPFEWNAASNSTVGRKKILFVDDEEEWRTVVAAALSGIGHAVLTAADASEAMHLTEGTSLGLIILDLDLAGESGLDLMKYLRHNQPGVPIILYTGLERDEAAVVAMQHAGADQYLRKGPLEELVEAVRRSFRY